MTEQSESPATEKRNMYGCTPCPKCKSEYRWPTQQRTIVCDDCGHVESGIPDLELMMALDVKTPKGYRKAWNGGRPPASTPQSEAFHAHLDGCAQCRNHPLALCPDGDRLLRAVVQGGA